jgi:hypothetical protein
VVNDLLECGLSAMMDLKPDCSVSYTLFVFRKAAFSKNAKRNGRDDIGRLVVKMFQVEVWLFQERLYC